MSQVTAPQTAKAMGSSEQLPQLPPLVRVFAMPADATPNGDIFGGQMDLAGGSLAAQRARGRCATVAVDGMVFHEPVFVGDEVSCYGKLVRTGRTSMTVRVEACGATCRPARFARSPRPSSSMWRSARTTARAGCRRHRSRGTRSARLEPAPGPGAGCF